MICWLLKVFNSISMHFAGSCRDYIPAKLTDRGILTRAWDVRSHIVLFIKGFAFILTEHSLSLVSVVWISLVLQEVSLWGVLSRSWQFILQRYILQFILNLRWILGTEKRSFALEKALAWEVGITDVSLLGFMLPTTSIFLYSPGPGSIPFFYMSLVTMNIKKTFHYFLFLRCQLSASNEGLPCQKCPQQHRRWELAISPLQLSQLPRCVFSSYYRVKLQKKMHSVTISDWKILAWYNELERASFHAL